MITAAIHSKKKKQSYSDQDPPLSFEFKLRLATIPDYGYF